MTAWHIFLRAGIDPMIIELRDKGFYAKYVHHFSCLATEAHISSADVSPCMSL